MKLPPSIQIAMAATPVLLKLVHVAAMPLKWQLSNWSNQYLHKKAPSAVDAAEGALYLEVRY